ncbi:hypothetical protein [Rubritalea sp.]|uniref:hypothetical protein n=1 Tax=Rubritalea sp. TaxID=2109375 RepID=UPI003EF242BA
MRWLTHAKEVVAVVDSVLVFVTLRVYLVTMAQALWMRLREVQWKDYDVSEGSADRLEKVLQDLASRKRARAMKASHDVWRLLCRNGTHSAAVVALPYLAEIIEISTEDVQIEIADCIKSCASGLPSDCVWRERFKCVAGKSLPHLKRLRSKGDLEIALKSAIEALQCL